MTFLEPPFWARGSFRYGAPHVAVRFVAPVTAPTEPITVAEMKDHLKISLTEAGQDALIARYIRAARTYVENRTHRPIVLQDCDVLYDALPPYGWIDLPFTPVAAVTWIKTTDVAGITTTMDPAAYLLDAASEPARIGLPTGSTWPAGLRAFQPIAIRLAVGYTTVPEDIVEAIRLLVGHYERNRAAAAVGVRFDATLPFGVDDILAPYELIGVA